MPTFGAAVSVQVECFQPWRILVVRRDSMTSVVLQVLRRRAAEDCSCAFCSIDFPSFERNYLIVVADFHDNPIATDS